MRAGKTEGESLLNPPWQVTADSAAPEDRPVLPCPAELSACAARGDTPNAALAEPPPHSLAASPARRPREAQTEHERILRRCLAVDEQGPERPLEVRGTIKDGGLAFDQLGPLALGCRRWEVWAGFVGRGLWTMGYQV